MFIVIETFSYVFVDDLACVQTSPLPQKKIGRRDVCESPRIIVFPFPRNVALIGYDANNLQCCDWWMNLGIDSPEKNSVFVNSLPHLYLFTWISALWNRKVKLRPPMFAAPVGDGRTGINAKSEILYLDFSVDISWKCSASLCTDAKAIFWPTCAGYDS